MEKEKIIQIAFKDGDANPVMLTNKGRIIALVTTFSNNIYHYEYTDITPDLDNIK